MMADRRRPGPAFIAGGPGPGQPAARPDRRVVRQRLPGPRDRPAEDPVPGLPRRGLGARRGPQRLPPPGRGVRRAPGDRRGPPGRRRQAARPGHGPAHSLRHQVLVPAPCPTPPGRPPTADDRIDERVRRERSSPMRTSPSSGPRRSPCALAGGRRGRAGEARVQPRHPADPGGELLRLPRARQRRPQGRPAARPARRRPSRPSAIVPGKPGEERAGRAHLLGRRRAR